MVECRYSAPSAPQQSVSVGVLIKTPSSSLPSRVAGVGLYTVLLRIAKGNHFDLLDGLSKMSVVFVLKKVDICISNPTDETYSSYYPSSSLPLRVLLGTPLYLEVLLHCSTPEAVLLVHYCIAFPSSATNALVLIYDGYENALGCEIWVSRLPLGFKMPSFSGVPTPSIGLWPS